jgi:hypothetical protein
MDGARSDDAMTLEHRTRDLSGSATRFRRLDLWPALRRLREPLEKLLGREDLDLVLAA